MDNRPLDYYQEVGVYMIRNPPRPHMAAQVPEPVCALLPVLGRTLVRVPVPVVVRVLVQGRWYVMYAVQCLAVVIPSC